jgi:YihY family inner membrane protein
MMAAGLAFYFLLGLIPFLFITTALAGYVFGRNPEVFANMSAALVGLLPPGLGERILQQVQSAVEGWETFGVLGLISLFFVAMGLFEAIDWGINGAMGTRKKVGFLTGRLLFLAYVMGAIVFFSLAGVADYLFHLMLATPALSEFSQKIHIPRRLVAMVAFALFMFILYITIPVRTPKVTRAVVVALVVAGVWAVLQKLGASVTVYISRRHAVYGALAGAALFLTWMYLLALLILLGATVLDTWARLTRPESPQPPAAAPD